MDLPGACLTSKKRNFEFLFYFTIPSSSFMEAQNQFCEQLERAYSACPNNDVKLVMGECER
jgi:hypothetical protein